MSKNDNKETGLSKREAMRQKRAAEARRNRLFVVGGIIIVALILGLVIVMPLALNATQPVGDFVKITPKTLPNPNGLALGDPNAKVRIDVYEDFLCHACKSFADNIEPRVIAEIVEPGLAYYVYRQFPFLDDGSVSKESDQSANASMCAAEQGRFWDYKDILYANQTNMEGQFNDQRLIAFADSLGLDMAAFEPCFAENKYWDQIQADLAAGESIVDGTPSVFVNGVNVAPSVVPSFDQILQAVQAAQSN
jgi:protein-disulfide isomerase